MHTCRVRGCTKMSLQLTLQRNKLPHVDKYKYLRMRIDKAYPGEDLLLEPGHCLK